MQNLVEEKRLAKHSDPQRVQKVNECYMSRHASDNCLALHVTTAWMNIVTEILVSKQFKLSTTRKEKKSYLLANVFLTLKLSLKNVSLPFTIEGEIVLQQNLVI